jgi:hypothetical protein
MHGGEEKFTGILVREPETKRPLGRPTRPYDNIKIDL